VNIYQAKECFVNQRRGLEGVLLALAHHVPPGDPLELLVQEGRQSVERTPVARAPGAQQHSDVSRAAGSGRPLHRAEYSSFAAALLPPVLVFIDRLSIDRESPWMRQAIS
jgi:hypothetical protein